MHLRVPEHQFGVIRVIEEQSTTLRPCISLIDAARAHGYDNVQ